MILGAPLGRFPLGQIADLNDAVLVAVEDADVAAFTAASTFIGILDAIEADDIAAFVGRTTTAGILDAIEDEDQAAFTVRVLDVIVGELAAIEDEDRVSIELLRGEVAYLAATEDEDTAEMRGRTWAVYGEACGGKTVCLDGRRAKDPDVEASLRDRDTDTCRTWKRVA